MKQVNNLWKPVVGIIGIGIGIGIAIGIDFDSEKVNPNDNLPELIDLLHDFVVKNDLGKVCFAPVDVKFSSIR